MHFHPRQCTIPVSEVLTTGIESTIKSRAIINITIDLLTCKLNQYICTEKNIKRNDKIKCKH
jgi:hypothetical protein